MRTRRIVLNLLEDYYALRYLFEQEFSFNSGVSFARKVWCWTRGFSSDKYILYNLKENAFRLYLSDFQRRKTAMINEPYSILLNDKNLFTRLLEQEDLTAQTYGKVKHGKIIFDDEELSLDSFLEFVHEQGRVIIKSFYGGGGKAIYRLAAGPDKLLLNDAETDKEELHSFIKSLNNYMIAEHIAQADYSAKIYPGTVNTIRVLTMLDPHSREVFIPIAVHKFGSAKTKPADNVWRGGMTALVDIETGILQRSALHMEKNKKIQWQELHPDTKERIEGTAIPNWQLVKDRIIQVAQSMDFLKYVGWDVVVTNAGIKIIEGNNFSDVNILQIHQPLLRDKRAREFYKYHGII